MKRWVGARFGEHGGRPGDGEAEDVAYVVAGVGQERDGIAQKAIDHLENDEAGIEGDPDCKGGAEARGRVEAADPAVTVMSAMIVIVAGVLVDMRHDLTPQRG